MEGITQLLSIRQSQAADQGKQIYAKLPLKLQSGSIFVNEGDGWLYLSAYICSTLFFFLAYFLIRQIFLTFNITAYINRSKALRIRYVTLWVNNVHHLIVIPFALYSLGTACSPNSNWPVAGVTSYFAWFSNDQCFLQFDQNFAYAIMITNGFLTMDYVVTKYWILDRNKLSKQTEIHHIMAFSGFTISLFSGYGLPGVSTCSLLCEISAIFLNYREMFGKENMNSPLNQVN